MFFAIYGSIISKHKIFFRLRAYILIILCKRSVVDIIYTFIIPFVFCIRGNVYTTLTIRTSST